MVTSSQISPLDLKMTSIFIENTLKDIESESVHKKRKQKKGRDDKRQKISNKQRV